VLGAALLLVTTSTVYRTVADANQHKAAYGQTIAVAVAQTDAQPGDKVGQRARLVELPRALVPTGAVTAAAFDDAQNTNAGFRRPLRSGAVLTDLNIGAAPVTVDDAAVVAVPIGPATPPLVAGQQVVVVLHQDAFSGQEGRLVDAVTYGVSDTQVLLAVPMADLQHVSAAVGANGVTLALAGTQ